MDPWAAGCIGALVVVEVTAAGIVRVAVGFLAAAAESLSRFVSALS